jgi:hypothetical protein
LALSKTRPQWKSCIFLTEVAREAEEQGLEPEEIEARLRETRLWKLLQLLKQERNFVVAVLAVLIQIYDAFLRPQPASTAPQVTVNVTVQTDQIVQELEKQFDAGHCGDDQTPSKSAPEQLPHREGAARKMR